MAFNLRHMEPISFCVCTETWRDEDQPMSTEDSRPQPKGSGTASPSFWITMARGVFAIVLGLALFFQPQKTQVMLVTFMGIFWLVNGILNIRWGVTGQRPRALSMATGIIGVLAGLGAISRRFVEPSEAEVLVVYSLGAVILLTGILHLTEGFRRGPDAWQHRRHLAAILGVFEIVLGALVILDPLERGNLAYAVGSLWALLVGALLIGDALRMRVQERRGSAAPTILIDRPWILSYNGAPILPEGQYPRPLHKEEPH